MRPVVVVLGLIAVVSVAFNLAAMINMLGGGAARFGAAPTAATPAALSGVGGAATAMDLRARMGMQEDARSLVAEESFLRASEYTGAGGPTAALGAPAATWRTPWLASALLSLCVGLARALLLLAPAALWVSLYVAWRLRLAPSTGRRARRLLAAALGSFFLLLGADVAGVAGAGVALCAYQVAAAAAALRWVYVSQGWRRAATFWVLVGRMIAHYKLVRGEWGRSVGRGSDEVS